MNARGWRGVLPLCIEKTLEILEAPGGEFKAGCKVLCF